MQAPRTTHPIDSVSGLDYRKLYDQNLYRFAPKYVMAARFAQHEHHARKLRQLMLRTSGLELCCDEQWLELEHDLGPGVYTEALYQLSHLEMLPEAARDILLAILDHRRTMSLALGREVSLLAAASDYLTGVRPMLKDPVLLESGLLALKEEIALKDELTGLFNRRYFNQELPREIERFRRFGQPFALLLLDLDNFKAFNDAHGHSAGDAALAQLSTLMRHGARGYDHVVRYGGEEFALILPQSRQHDALTVAERIREEAARQHILYESRLLGPVTVSIGAAIFPQDALDMETLVQRADEALFEAKAVRNMVRMYRDAKRQHPRFPLSDPLTVRMVSGDLTLAEARSLDVSFGGMLVETPRSLPQNTALSVVLSDPLKGLTLPIQAIVRRVSNSDGQTFHLGLSFTLDSLEDQKTLLSLIETRALPDSGRSPHRPPGLTP